MSSSDSYSEYVDGVNYCLSQARSLQLTETNTVYVTLASQSTRPNFSASDGSAHFGTSREVIVSFVQPTRYVIGSVWLDCSSILTGELPTFKVTLTAYPAIAKWWPLDSLSSVFNNALAIQQGTVATGSSTTTMIYPREPLPVTADGQTAFVLSIPPATAALLNLEVNGVAYNTPAAYTLSGTAVTWLSPFILRTTDSVYALYA